MLWLLFIGRWSVSHCDNLAKVALHWTQVYKVAVAYGWSPNEQQSQRQTLLSSFGDLDVSYGFQWPDTKMAPSQLFEKGGRRLTNTFFTGKKLIKFFQEHFLQISSSSFFAKTVKVTVFQEEEKESFFSFLSERKLLKTNNRLNLPFFSLSKFFSPFFVKERWIFDVSQRWNYFLASTLATNLGLLKVKNSDDWRKSIKRETICFHSLIQKFF